MYIDLSDESINNEKNFTNKNISTKFSSVVSKNLEYYSKTKKKNIYINNSIILDHKKII